MWPAAGRSPTLIGVAMDESECRRGAWTRCEDALLCELVSKLGTSSWVAISRGMMSRSAKSCRLRCVAEQKGGPCCRELACLLVRV